jgi:hypothetical protein
MPFPTSYKIVGGGFSSQAVFSNPKVTKKLAKGKITRVKKIQCDRGKYSFVFEDNWSQEVLSDTVPPFFENLDEIKELDEEKRLNLMSAAGWGIVGGLATGGIGLLAGALFAGRGKSITYGLRLKDGSHFICISCSKDYAKLRADTNRF